MLVSLRARVAFVAVAALAVSDARADEKPKLSQLSAVSVKATSDEVRLTIEGSKAPDFTSFTKADPFRVVVDWAGSRLDGVEPERTFDRGLVRRIVTRQFDSEAEKISRVEIELSRETSYHVATDGTRITVHFVPVPDPIPTTAPVAAPAPEEKVVEVAAYVPEGPLTEPAIPIPSAVPAPQPAPVLAGATPAPSPVAPAPEPELAKVADAREELAAIGAPAADLVAPKSAPKAATPVAKAEVPAPAKAAPTLAAAEGPLMEPAMDADLAPVPTKLEPAKVAAAEPKSEAPQRLASYVPPVQVDTKPQRVEPAPAASAPPKVEAPVAAPASREESRTQQIASSAQVGSDWEPPGVGQPNAANGSKVWSERPPAARERAPAPALPVVKLAKAQDAIEPESSLPMDPDVREERPRPALPSDADDFDPGPRVMTYIGFQQMADVSRVFVRLDGKARYKQLGGGSSFVLELQSTSVPVKNNTRPLDTTYFNSPVTMVQAVPSGGVTRIEVKLRESVPFQIKRIGTTIAVDFKRAR